MQREWAERVLEYTRQSTLILFLGTHHIFNRLKEKILHLWNWSVN